jgi:hypothetical protein
MEIQPADENEDKEDEYYQLYNSKENEIKRYIENNFSKLNFSLDFSDYDFIQDGSEKITGIKVKSVNIIADSLENVDDSDANQISVKFELEVKVDYDINASYVSLKDIYYDEEDGREHGREEIDIAFSKSSEFYVEVTFTLSKNKNGSLCNMAIEIDPNNMLGEIVVNDEGFEDKH